MSSPKRVLTIGDFHCGSWSGLTPPQHDSEPALIHQHKHNLWEKRREAWKLFAGQVEALRPIDGLIANGDLLDGPSPKVGGTDSITVDVHEQAMMAADIIKFVDAEKKYAVHGTGYHTGNTVDFEDFVDDVVHFDKLGDHDWVSVNGVIFDYKHKIPSSGSRTGRATALLTENLWADVWSLRGEYPKGAIILRSHTHYFMHVDDGMFAGFILPALMDYGSKYGTRECRGTVDFGMVWFDVAGPNDWGWSKKLWRHSMQAPIIAWE